MSAGTDPTFYRSPAEAIAAARVSPPPAIEKDVVRVPIVGLGCVAGAAGTARCAPSPRTSP